MMDLGRMESGVEMNRPGMWGRVKGHGRSQEEKKKVLDVGTLWVIDRRYTSCHRCELSVALGLVVLYCCDATQTIL
jgi:hypothetical protein